MNWKVVLHSVVAAAGGGAITSLSAYIVDPSAFHDWRKIGSVAAAGALTGVLALLKQSPVQPSANAPQGKIGAGAALLIAFLALSLTACNQNTIAALVSTLGNSCSALANIQGNPTLAATIKADADQAAKDVLAWKPGTDSELAVQAIHVLENDLGLICKTIPGQPGQDCQKYQPLIVLALGTADSIIAIVQPQRQMAKPQKTCPVFDLACREPKQAPKDAKEFKQRWNAIVAGDPALAKAAIK